MLDLIRRIGTEFGMHIIVSSHHLEEVERICDAVVIVEGGEVVHAGTLADVRRGPAGLVVEVDGRAEELASILAGRGFAVTVDGGVLLLDADDDSVYDAVRDAVADLERRAAAARAARTDAGRRLPGGRSVTTGQDAQLFDLGYRGYDGAARAAGQGDPDAGGVHDAARARAGARRATQGLARDHARDRVPAGLRLGRGRVDRRQHPPPTT